MNIDAINDKPSFSTGKKDRAKAVVQAVSLSAACLATILFALAYSADVQPPIAGVGISLCFIAVMFLVYAIATYSNLKLASWLFAIAVLSVFTAGTAIMGGIHAPIILGLIIAPLYGSLVLNIRESLAILCLTIAVIGFFIAAPSLGIHFPDNNLTPEELSVRSGTWQIGCICMTFVALWRYDALNDKLSITLTEQAATDKMTGFYSKDVAETLLYQQVQVSKRNQEPLSVLIIDIDYFKSINDTLGHQTGDLYIKRVAEVMRQEVQRNMDSIGRIGGDEFLIILPQTESTEAERIANKIRLRVASIPLPKQLVEHDAMSLSIGLLTYSGHPAYNHEDIYKAADEQLYSAKFAGRNVVSCRTINNPSARIYAAA
jgi:diguanylate cyclase (GGDEF)-like protein